MHVISLRARATTGVDDAFSTDAALAADVATPGDRSASESGKEFTALITAVRWATTTAALLLLSTDGGPERAEVAGAAVLAYALWRTVHPIRVSGGRRHIVTATLVEAAVMVTTVVATGYWSSPYALGLFTAVMVAGFAGGRHLAVPVAVATLIAVAVPYHALNVGASERLSVQWAGELILLAIVASYARRLTMQATSEKSGFLRRLHQLSQANALLLQLHQMAETLPTSVDLNETVESARTRLRELFDPDAMVVLLRDDSGRWSPAFSSAPDLWRDLIDDELPPTLRSVVEGLGPRLLTFGAGEQVGLAPGVSSGIYASLYARRRLIGLIAVERSRSPDFDENHVSVMEAFAQQLAVALDNARWFMRIGTLAAEQERSRIARDLHDRVGQSLALVGFELDRGVRNSHDADSAALLTDLRQKIGSVVAELRETLYDLRSDVSEERDLVSILTEFLARVRERSGIGVEFTHETTRRLPLQVEREVWRIAQEAVTNAERHSGASSLSVSWTSTAANALLVVSDDGSGVNVGAFRRADSYGLVGMQERADAIGATLTITSPADTGTAVRLELHR
ncbi:MAG: GAF domain-containing sensor histidine kinase [Actinomycetota bacterium]|nr:GAF domain-containing sensor histidine kinase [Actinomycetota bacterium]